MDFISGVHIRSFRGIKENLQIVPKLQSLMFIFQSGLLRNNLWNVRIF